jgi:mycothiol synthase
MISTTGSPSPTQTTEHDLKITPFRWEHFRAVVELSAISLAADSIEGSVIYEEEEHEWRSPELDPERQCLLAFDRDGRMAAWAVTENPRELNHAYGNVMVHPDYRHTNIGSTLIRQTDAGFFNEVEALVTQDRSIFVQRWARDSATYYQKLYAAEGYQIVRHFFTMRIGLDQPLAPVRLPDGLEIRPFDPETQAEVVFEAVDGAFQDHWGHAPVTFDIWRHDRIEAPFFDPRLWFVVWAGDEVASVAMCRAWGEDIPGLAWVTNLATPRHFRRQGLGGMLLRHAFYEFQHQGFDKAGLGVDSANASGAVGMYERAGMHVHSTSMVFRKLLRGNPDDLAK